MPKYQCPECEAVLRRAEAIAPGKKIRCPKCEAVFPAKPMAEEAEPAKEAAGAYAVLTPAAAPSPPAAPKPPEEEEENSNPYAVIKESGDEVKPEIHLGSLRDRFAKSKVGPAMYKTVMPSNYLLRLGLFSCAVAVFVFGYGLFPVIFCEANPLRPFIRPRVNIMLEATFMFILGAIMCAGASKMHDLTSYTWSIIGSIMAILIYVPLGILLFLTYVLVTIRAGMVNPYLTGLVITITALSFAGVWCLIVLFNKQVREGFQERAEENQY